MSNLDCKSVQQPINLVAKMVRTPSLQPLPQFFLQICGKNVSRISSLKLISPMCTTIPLHQVCPRFTSASILGLNSKLSSPSSYET